MGTRCKMDGLKPCSHFNVFSNMVLMKRFVLPHLEAGQKQLLHLVQQNQVEKTSKTTCSQRLSSPGHASSGAITGPPVSYNLSRVKAVFGLKYLPRNRS